jgi:cell division protein FtsI/penicillin-binding protein 2
MHLVTAPPRPSTRTRRIVTQTALAPAVAAALVLLALGCQQRPAPEAAARAYLAAWQQGDYAAMYALLTARAREQVGPEAFAARYQAAGATAGLRSVTPTLGARAAGSDERQARFPVTTRWETERVGGFAQETALPLSYEGERWAVDWTPALLLADLQAGDTVEYVSEAATRGAILDRIGRDFAAPGVEDRYPGGTLAAHALGYLEPPPDGAAAEAGAAAQVGGAGLERWGEQYLAGRPGGRLAILDAAGRERTTVARRPPAGGATLELTLDRELQRRAEALLDGYVGALVALDARDGAVLALASRPTFDAALVSAGEPATPSALLDRATDATYPAASLFKVVVMGAALDVGESDPAAPFRCTGLWTGLGDGSALEDSVAGGHGTITLADGLVQSCNTVFYELGKRLDAVDPLLLPTVARGFGLGAPTGLVGLAEAAGAVPDPRLKEAAGGAWGPRDAVEFAIGHGGLEVTPLQVARLFAALATDGTLRRPVLVRHVYAADGRLLRSETTEAQGTVPVADEHRRAVQAAMRGVLADPRGTASGAFRGFAVPAAGKTGSAENDGPRLHAWFAGYAPADAPEVVVVALVEQGNSGGVTAAPLARGLLDAYFAAR